MQHLDEGTIHAWLDGALPNDEARAVEAHVAECAACADAVAEARGLIAASSRILSALDGVPAIHADDEGGEDDGGLRLILERGHRAPPKRWLRGPGLAAAAVVVLAIGTVAVIRSRQQERASMNGVVTSPVAIGGDEGRAAARAKDAPVPAGTPTAAKEVDQVPKARTAPAETRSSVVAVPAAPPPRARESAREVARGAPANEVLAGKVLMKKNQPVTADSTRAFQAGARQLAEVAPAERAQVRDNRAVEAKVKALAATPLDSVSSASVQARFVTPIPARQDSMARADVASRVPPNAGTVAVKGALQSAKAGAAGGANNALSVSQRPLSAGYLGCFQLQPEASARDAALPQMPTLFALDSQPSPEPRFQNSRRARDLTSAVPSRLGGWRVMADTLEIEWWAPSGTTMLFMTRQNALLVGHAETRDAGGARVYAPTVRFRGADCARVR
jgi:hypothetical protein